MRRNGLLKRTTAMVLSSVMILSGILYGCSNDEENDKTGKENQNQQTGEIPELSDWSNVEVKSSGVKEGNAILMDSGISVVFDNELNKNVVKIDGETGYLQLPKEIWKDADEGFTVSLKIKADKDMSDSANVFQTNLCGYAVGDTFWKDAPEISITKAGKIRIYVGGRTIDGVYSPLATYNNGGAGDDLNYAEPGGHKTRYEAESTAIETDKWQDMILSVSGESVALYMNGEKTELKADESTDIKSTLEYLFGNYDGGENILKQYAYSSIGNSVYSDTDNFKGMVSDICIYEKALSYDEVKNKKEIAYKWDFDTEDLEYENKATNKESDLTKYMWDLQLTEVENVKTVSPDGKQTVQVWRDENGGFYYSVKAEETVIIESSAIGMKLQDCDLSMEMELVKESVKTQEIKETYDTLTGSSDKAENHCNETRFTLKNENGSFDFVIRSFDDGMAYRYENVNKNGAENVVVNDERSECILPQISTIWSFALNGTYEGEYVKRNSSQLEALSMTLSTPMLANVEAYWVLLTEAQVFNNNGDFCSNALKTESGSSKLEWTFGLDRDPNKESVGELDSPGHINITKIETKNGFSTPWRVAVISDDIEAFCKSSIISDLNPAADDILFADTSWIKPGRVAWSWWSEDAEQGNYDKHIEYIDFAAENGWEYVCMDVGWRDFEDRLEEICDYAQAKGVGIFVWINYRDMKNIDNMEKLFSEWKAAGVVGVKTDYFESDSQDVLDVMEKAAICSAKNKLMILYHGCVRPAGEYRTYPNILSTEAVQGEEWHKWNAYPTVENCLLYPFTRNICGSMDYTPVATKVGSNESTYGFGLAMTVVYESSLQHLAYAAASYKSYNGLSFLNNLSTTWEETRLIEGLPGEYVTYARRSGNNWYIGAMTKETRQTAVKLDFLGESTYNAYIYKDNEDGTQLILEEKQVTNKDVLTFDLLAAGGVAVLITEEKIDTTVSQSQDMNNPDYIYYEAESTNNTLAGTAVMQSSAFCSGSQKVGYVGKGAGNTLTFNKIAVEKEGTYKLMLYYCCGEDRKVTIKVNGNDSYEITGLNSGDYVHTSVAEIEVQLKAGENTIELSNVSYYAPDIDRIAVAKQAE